MTKYDNFPIASQRVPVQYGKLSKRERHCYILGRTGSLHDPPYIMTSYYRIAPGELGAKKIFFDKQWNGKQDGTIAVNGRVCIQKRYIHFNNLPEEIQKRIRAKLNAKREYGF